MDYRFHLLALVVLGVACGPTESGAPDVDGRDAGTGVGDEFDGDGGGMPSCDEVVEAETIAKTPDVLLVVDRSGSMESNLHPTIPERKLDLMTNAIQQLVSARIDSVRFGLMAFPWKDDCDIGEVVVEVGSSDAQAFPDALQDAGAEGSTPTYGTMVAAGEYLQSLPTNVHGQYIVLATDGQPNCKNDDDVDDVAAALLGEGIKTYVLGFGAGAVDVGELENVAVAGGTQRFYTALSPDELDQALGAIAGEISSLSCVQQLAHTPQDPSVLRVDFDGLPVDPASWTYDPATNAITFTGAACESLESGMVIELRIDYGCVVVL